MTPWSVACQSWDSPGKNTGVGCHFLLQGIFPTQGSNPGLLHCRQILYPESRGKPRLGPDLINPIATSLQTCELENRNDICCKPLDLSGAHNEDQRRQWHPIPVLLPGKSHGLRSLVGQSPWRREELDTTE